MKVITNNVPRDVLNGFDLTDSERKEFDYINFDEDCGSFFRYRGEVYDLGEFLCWDNPESPTRDKWDGYSSDSYFSGLVVRYVDDFERVVVGRYFS